MLKKLFLLLCFLPVYLSAQKEFVDTVYAVTLQEFNVPPKLAYVAQDLIAFDFKAELLDASGNKLRDCPYFIQDPPNQKEIEIAVRKKSSDMRAGIAVKVVVIESIEEVGTYIVKFIVKGTGENRSPAAKDYYYLVNITYPTIVVPVQLRNEYYYGEQEAFSFATVEYTNPNNYSYQIVDEKGAIIEQGKGALVKLDNLLKEVKNVGKTLTVKGLYHDKVFTYKLPNSDSTKQSQWTFKVSQPGLNWFSSWSDKDNPDWRISVDNDRAKSFLVGYMAKVPGGIIVVPPEIKRLRVISDPDGFVTSSSPKPSPLFNYINIAVKDDFIAYGDEQYIKLTFTFETQFGKETKVFYATVIK